MSMTICLSGKRMCVFVCFLPDWSPTHVMSKRVLCRSCRHNVKTDSTTYWISLNINALLSFHNKTSSLNGWYKMMDSNSWKGECITIRCSSHLWFLTQLNCLIPSRSSQARSTAVCSPSGGQTKTEPDRRHSPLAGLCHPRWTGKP